MDMLWPAYCKITVGGLDYLDTTLLDLVVEVGSCGDHGLHDLGLYYEGFL